MIEKKDLIWMYAPSYVAANPNTARAYEVISMQVIPSISMGGYPVEFIYDNVMDTINIVCPRLLIDSSLLDTVFKDAGFKEKPIPEKDIDASDELRAALLGGSNFNTQWT